MAAAPDHAATTAPRRIRDLVDVRAHPAVVQLAHLEADDPDWISASFCTTPDLGRHLTALLRALGEATGRGAFLIGQYGSGKSHFMAFLAQGLRRGTLRPTAPGGGEEAAPHVVTLSLVHYAADARLEDVVSRALDMETGVGDRRPAWERLHERHPRGVLLLIDELSEFLRSKADRRAFTEDVRFLQFLGEWAERHRLWVVAGMQEQIEHTGDLDYGLYRKIKDRYPMRLLLSPGHVRDLIRDGLLVKHAGYDEAVGKIADDIRRALPDLAIDRATLSALYPIHPATLELLEEVRDRFSQARGAVDFVMSRLAGSPSRGIEPFLDRPWGELLTPDAIVDHFRELFELQSEFVPLAQVVLPFFDKHLEQMFAPAARAELARRVVKLLVLARLSPSREGITPSEAAAWLLLRASRLDAGKNIAVVRSVLEQLATDGRYVVRDGDRFCLDVREDDAATLQRHLEREISELAEVGDAVFEQLVPLLEGGAFDPFALPLGQAQPRVLRWHFHERSYTVFLGNDEPPPANGMLLCVRLPWGDIAHAPGAHTLVPQRLAVAPRHVELAALARLRERSWSEPTRQRLHARIGDGTAGLENDVKAAYLQAELLDPTGIRLPVAPGEGRGGFTAWLERQAEHVLRRIYASFERFAPGHGPLPVEVLRRFANHALANELTDPNADEHVRLVREAYLVPMGLLARQGQGYVVPKSLDRNELVRLLQPLLEHEPAPSTVEEHLAQPVYGLVRDQVRVLLITLQSLGAVDVRKDEKSYRELSDMLPDPLVYDRVVAGRALGSDQLRQLQQLCEGLQVAVPRAWTVFAQRRAVQQLRERGGLFAQRMEPLLIRLRDQAEGGGLGDAIRDALAPWRALDIGAGAGDELDAFRRFLAEIGTPARFLERLAALRDLPDKLDRQLAELRRLRHLLGHPAVVRCDVADVRVRLDALGDPPALDRPDLVEHWLTDARALYERYEADYQQRHFAFWEQCKDHPIWQWQPPALAQSRHLGLDEPRDELARARARAGELRCRPPLSLAFQPLCTCGFGSDEGALERELARFSRAVDRIENELTRFFAQGNVRARLRKWADEGLDVGDRTLAYLDGGAPWPEVNDVALLDRHLAGLDTVRELGADELLAELGGRAWDKRAAVEAFERWLEALPDGRVRFARGHDLVEARGELVAWCVARALGTGEPLPPGLRTEELEAAAAKIQPRAVSEAALAVLEELGVGPAVEQRVLSWLLEGQLPFPPREKSSPAVCAAREVREPSTPVSPSAHGALAATVYAAHSHLAPVAGSRWLARLDELAATSLDPPPPALPDALRQAGEAQWLCVDCFGVAWLDTLHPVLKRALGAWCPGEVAFAFASSDTTTSAFYRELAEAGLARAFEKIDTLDALVHARTEPFADMVRLAAVELEVACKRVAARLDPAQRLIVFADHGFRLDPAGRAWVHGGPSTLERLVPIVSFEPRG